MSRDIEVMKYLQGKDFTSPTEIGFNVWGKGHHSASASPVCLRLTKYGLLIRNKRGHYKVNPLAREAQKKEEG